MAQNLYYRPEGKGKQEELDAWVMRELRKIEAVTQLLAEGYREVLHAAPNKPEEGMVVHADGTNWNPGAGVGRYAYISGAWVKL